jgi:hypothetical protein
VGVGLHQPFNDDKEFGGELWNIIWEFHSHEEDLGLCTFWWGRGKLLFYFIFFVFFIDYFYFIIVDFSFFILLFLRFMGIGGIF